MISRRNMMAQVGAGTALAGATGFVPVALAKPATDKRLVVVVLRGGLDGLAAVPPYTDPDYREVRSALALPEPGTEGGILDLDGKFGFHPALAPLHEMYRSRELLVFHAVATPYRARSHFDAQDLLENGTAAPHGARDGWLNRALKVHGPSDRRLGLAVGQAVPLVLRGDVPVGSWAPRRLPPASTDFLDRLAALYRADPVLGPAIQEGLKAQAMSDDVLGGQMMQRPGRGGTARALRASVKAVGKLLADPAGPRVAVFEAGGWDTHANQGVLTGRLANHLKGLSEGVTALKQALGPVWAETAVVVATEFGRTAAPNGTKGTDHGTAGVAFVAGGRVAGGRVLADWPGLSMDRLYQRRDLAPTTDLRAIFKGLLVGHLGLPAADVERAVFPGSGAAGMQKTILRV